MKTRVTESILALADEPQLFGRLKVRSEPGVWRMRIGEYRVGYRIDNKTQIVVRVGARGDFYSN